MNHEKGKNVDGLIADYLRRKELGDSITPEEFANQNNDFYDELCDYFSNEQFFARLSSGFYETLGAEDRPLGGLDVDGFDFSNDPTFGDYEILHEVARGGMGVVYRARQKKLNRDVALKMILAGTLAGDEDIRRFQKEAEAAGTLDHPGIVPVFDVGQIRGHYYLSMAFVDGTSLAEKLVEGPVPPETAATIAQQIAQAVQHAHERGVIHRDLKPANVLLDASQAPSTGEPTELLHKLRATHRSLDYQPRITDFGLAKRIDSNRELTASGQILGTPSYMPPEQAVGDVDNIRETSDVYSIGAILYAMLTGRPPFQADNPMDTVMQVVNQDPVSPRKLNPKIPKDLETVCVKCLEKSPDRRFQSAQELSDELGRFLDGRPIQSRQVSYLESARRWFVRQRKSVVASLLAVASVFVCIAAAIVTRYLVSQSQIGEISIKTDHAPVVVEILDDHQRKVVAPVTLPSSKPTALQSKDYTLRIHGDGRLSQDYVTRIPKSSTIQVNANLEDQAYWNTLEVDRTFVCIRLDQQNDLLDLGQTGIRRISGTTRKVIWEQPLVGETSEIVKRMPGMRWPWTRQPVYYGGLGAYKEQPFVRAVPDLDGDARDDILFAARHQAWVAAFSGDSGRLIWSVQRANEVETKIADHKSFGRSRVVAEPIPFGDLNGDGIDDYAVTFATRKDAEINTSNAERWFEVLSGVDGASLAKNSISADAFVLNATEEIPYQFRWYSERGGLSSSSGSVQRLNTFHTRRLDGGYMRSGPTAYLPDVVGRVNIAGEETFALITGMTIEYFDPKTGESTSTADKLPLRPHRKAIVQDVDSDGSDELVFLHQPAEESRSYHRALPAIVFVWSLAEKRLLWSKAIDAVWLVDRNWRVPRADWPKVADLDQDNRFEIIAPCSTSADVYYETPSWGAIGVFDAVTGTEKWQVRIPSLDPQIDNFQVVPDVDSDGVDEILTVTVSPKNDSVFADCFSGSDGKKLWSNSSPFPFDATEKTNIWIGETFLWDTGKEGTLVVQTVPSSNHDVAPTAYLFDLQTGQSRGSGQNVFVRAFADFDSDGVDELISYRPWDFHRFDNGGRVDVLRHLDSNGWRRLGGRRYYPTDDLDSGGLPDLINWDVDVLSLVSGETGRTIWQYRGSQSGAGSFGFNNMTPVKTIADINGDGVSELLMPVAPLPRRTNYEPFHLISGRTGKTIWIGGPQTAEQQFINSHVTADFNQDGVLDIAVLAAQSDQLPNGRLEKKARLMAISGTNGRTIWTLPMADGPEVNVEWTRFCNNLISRRAKVTRKDTNTMIATGLLNDDSIPDVISIFGREDGVFEIRAIDVQSGQTIWRQPLRRRESANETLLNTRVTVNEIISGEPEKVLVLELVNDGPQSTLASLVCRNGSDGAEIWNWTASVERNNLMTQAYHIQKRPYAHLLASNDPEKRIAIGFSSRIVILDARGKRIVEKKFTMNQGDAEIWPVDINGDGNDEIIARPYYLAAFDASSGDEIWRTPSENAFAGQVEKIFTNSEQPPLIVARQNLYSADTKMSISSFIGIDGKTGDEVWSSRFPQPRNGRDRTSIQQATLLAGTNPNELVYGLFTADQRTVCQPIVDRRLPKVDEKPQKQVDVRLIRPFPIRDHLTPVPFHSRRQTTRSFLWGVFSPFFLIILPFLYLKRSLRKRTWNLKTLLILPIVAGLFFLVIRTPPPHLDPRASINWGIRLLNAALCIPIWFVVFAWIRWLKNWNWIGIAMWMLTVICFAMFLAVSWIADDSSSLDGPRVYDWSGVHGLWWPSIFVSGWFIFIFETGRATKEMLEPPKIKN